MRASKVNHPHLSPQQRRVLELIATGHTDADIAFLLGISPATVSEYAGICLDKLGALNRANALAIALGRRVIKNPYEE